MESTAQSTTSLVEKYGEMPSIFQNYRGGGSCFKIDENGCYEILAIAREAFGPDDFAYFVIHLEGYFINEEGFQFLQNFCDTLTAAYNRKNTLVRHVPRRAYCMMRLHESDYYWTLQKNAIEAGFQMRTFDNLTTVSKWHDENWHAMRKMCNVEKQNDEITKKVETLQL